MPITIDGTTGISGVDGSAGTPAVIGSDADTGLVFAAGQVSASINGVAGNVPLVSGTAQNSTSGTSIDFTGIPSWVKRVTVVFNGVSTSGTSNYVVRVGTSGGIQSTGYTGAGQSGGAVTFSTTGILININAAASLTTVGSCVWVQHSGNTWVATGAVFPTATNGPTYSGSAVALSGALDRVRITTANGTDTFNAGTINILYE